VDFIDAKQYEGEVVCPKYTVALAWSAPETAREKKSTEKTDVYSFGVLIFELLTGKEPFEGVKHGQIIERINSGKSITDGLDTSSMPKEAVELMEQCLQKDAGIRPTFDQIIQILQNHAQ
jgi:serine/threonine protein kinase